MNAESRRDGHDLYSFGEFTIDVRDRCLTHGTRPVHLAPKTYDVLVALVRRAGRLVTKRDLLDDVWHGVFVAEGILSVHVTFLRKALGDARCSPSYIETVSGSGYRFVGPVVRTLREEAAAAETPACLEREVRP